MAQTTKRGSCLKLFNEVVSEAQSDNDCVIWPYARNDNGYGVFGRQRGQVKSVLVSRVVCAEVWGMPPTPKHVAAHSCGNGSEGCINPKHLSWKTSKENVHDTIRHGKANRGERNGQAKLTNEEVREIKSMLGLSKQADLARKYNVDGSVISNIKRGKHWRTVV